MSDRDVDPRLHAWVRSPVEPTAPDELRRQVLAIPATEPTTRQRRWIRLRPGSQPTAGADQGRDESRLPALTATRDSGGTRSMFSATKLVAAAASVALLGAVTLAVPFSRQQPTQAPGAEAPAAAFLGEFSSYTGKMEMLGQDELGSARSFDWGSSTTGEQWTTRLTTTDPRYSGLVTGIHNYYQARSGGPYVRVHTSRVFAEESDGTWISSGHGYQDAETSAVTWVTHSTGEGVYEGLTALNLCVKAPGARDMDCHGIIFEGQWPELPSAAPTEVDEAYGTP